MTALEIAVTSSAGARVACRAGADRVELCSALEVGGLTPSSGLLETTLEALEDAPDAWQGVHVLVRPRPGDFVYDADELATAVREVRSVCRYGADGVVIGALTRDGRIDVDAIRAMAETAREERTRVRITCHRAIDQTPAVLDAFAAVCADGLVDRVLTSGGRPAAGQATTELAEMVRLAEGRVEVMAGGGVLIEDVPQLVSAGVDAVHLSAKKRVPGAGGRVSLGAGDSDPGAYFVTDGGVVAAARALLTGP